MDKIDDEMDPDEYVYPPGLMPGADAEYQSVTHDDNVRIFNVDDDVDEEWIQSDCGVWILR
jgi:hypothetical protein